MTCPSCKGTKKIHLFSSTAECTDCKFHIDPPPLSEWRQAPEMVQISGYHYPSGTLLWLHADQPIGLGTRVSEAGYLAVRASQPGEYSVGVADGCYTRDPKGGYLVVIELDATK